MKAKLIHFSDLQVDQIQKDADEREISFTEMLRRIVDRHYEDELYDQHDNERQ